jgi:phosphoserine aminotransferase
MISFYPGPSRIHNDIPKYMMDACGSGILSENHRSEAFVALTKECMGSLKEKLNIPEEYWIFFTTSATECWHILANSFQAIPSFHIFNGAFGEKWFETSQCLKGNAGFLRFEREEEINIFQIPHQRGILCLTHNETSNGTEISEETLSAIRARFPESLIMIDATSSMGGVVLNFAAADVWFASVQKCFGLPAGLGVMICSPAALEKAAQLKNNKEYDSMINLYEKMKLWQTPCTPNVLGIYLLAKIAGGMEEISLTDKKLRSQANDYCSLLTSTNTIQLLVKNEKVRSKTVIAVQSQPEIIRNIKIAAREKGLLLGNGYGELAETSFRIANFPSILPEEIDVLKQFLKFY